MGIKALTLLGYRTLFLVLQFTATDGSGYGLYNFKASFGPQPMPFDIDVDPVFINETAIKARLTRFPIEISEPPYTEGVPVSNLSAIATYWSEEYDWFAVQSGINRKFKQFTTTVQIANDSHAAYSDPIALHFAHHQSSRADAIPLIFIHGWPGSFLEVEKILDDLVEPSLASDPAFYVVAPSIPGFGFSPPPQRPGVGLIEVGAAFNELMNQLGYERYVIQGGDFGSHTARYMASAYPDRVASILCNLYGVLANETDLQRDAADQTTPEEKVYIAFLNQSAPLAEAFWGIEAAVPLQMGILLTDSPVGNVAWPYLGMRGFTPGYTWSLEELITWSMMLYIQGPYGSVRIYKELQREGTLSFDFPFVHVPVGVLQYYPDAAYGAPYDWCQRTGNITSFVRKDTTVLGGHFPATVNPQELVKDIRQFWGSAAGGWQV